MTDRKAEMATSSDHDNSPESVFARSKANAESFEFNGLAEGESFRTATFECSRVELAAMRVRSAPIEPEDLESPDHAGSEGEAPETGSGETEQELELERCSTDSAERWVVRLEYVDGESRTLHEGASMWDACRALFAIAGFFKLPVFLDAPDFGCEAELVWTFPAALRAELDRSVAFRRRHEHAAAALAAMIELANHEIATGQRVDFGG